MNSLNKMLITKIERTSTHSNGVCVCVRAGHCELKVIVNENPNTQLYSKKDLKTFLEAEDAQKLSGYH